MSSTPTADSLADGVQHLLLAEKLNQLLTPPQTDYSAKSQKSTSNHSDSEKNGYIESLTEERDHLVQYSDEFNHALKLIEQEINRVREGEQPKEKEVTVGAPATGSLLSEIVVVPVDLYPNYNFVGRILGPRGTTAKQLESSTGCRVTILGRNKKDAGASPADSAAPVDNGPLRVQISVPSDAPDAAKRMEMGLNVVKALLVPPADGQDELKRQQLMVLANMNGTYRPRTTSSNTSHPFAGSGDYGNQFQNLLPYGYRLPGKSQSPHSETKSDCYNPKCAILRSLMDQNNINTSIPKIEDVLSVVHMYELMNRIRLANSSLLSRQEEVSKAQEIGNRMCSSIGVPRRPSATPASTPTTRRLFNAKPRPQH
ncbi:hypothetical protein GCK72_012876 [Caenorhabditis remanei]|uniref:K Homology domain-containing protein n=1 Tax=Caenorhabditis remanei TaxID=31234 RepID=A0A6A5GPB1_CAERE|nr:hypothetical protein GCK72_012876 [Caenorhabditis remanei]KAF1756423.1 hypothetical protein GCK72_012876 [Caenorhabditis remanei]